MVSKLTTLLLVMGFVHISFAGYGQITLNEKNIPLEKILTAIEKQSKYVFLYDPDDLNITTITVYVKNRTLQETLEKCFEGLPVVFSIVGNNVLLKKKNIIADVRFAGKIIDETGEPLPGVTVINKRTRKGTATDSTGSFSIPVTKGDLVRFSFVGYKDREIVIRDQTVINTSLELNAAGPEQVVVIGYGSSKRKDLTGAISPVDVSDLGQIPYNTFDNALAGKVAGVDVTKTDGTPGGMARVRIRGSSSLLGSNDPLYVIDGIPVQVRNNFIDPGFSLGSPSGNFALDAGGSGAALSTSFVNGLNSLGGLDPSNIESISVLKDASSTAIYGSKAASGVIIITTKTGRPNTQPQVAVDYYTTVSTPYKTPSLLNASQYKALLKEAAQNAFNEDVAIGGASLSATTSVLDSPAYFGTANTDWLRQVTRTTLSNNVGVSVSGGGKASKYFSSLAFSSTPGVIDGTGFQRISGKINLETQIGSKWRFVTNLLVGFSNQDLGDGSYMQAILARPDWGPRDAMGKYIDFNLQGAPSSSFLNPVALLTATNNARTLSLLGSVSGIYAFSNNIRLKSTASLNVQDYNQRNYVPSYLNITGPSGYVVYPGGIGSNANSRFADWFVENTLTYTRQMGKHSIDAVVGQSYETTKYSFFRATATGYTNNTTLTGLSAAATPLSVAGDDPLSPQSYLLSFYARANYGFRDKYLFTFTSRADGSSKFGPDNKYGFFPSGALAWRISRESFLKSAGWLNDLKLRASYGLTGNQNIGDQMFRTLYTPAQYAGNNALIPTQLGNEGIKWESTKEADLGLDVSLLNDRFYATFDYYNRQTNGALLMLPVATSSSYSSLLENAIGIRNRGFEASVGGDLIRSKDFRWAASINVSWSSSLVTRLARQVDLSQIISPAGLEKTADSTSQYSGNTLLVAGKPLGLISGFLVTGLIRTQAQLDAYQKQFGIFSAYFPLQIGDPLTKLDTSTAKDGYQLPLLGAFSTNGAPKYFGGMTQEFSYRRFDLRCYFTFSHGGHLLWAGHVASVEFYGTANANRSMLDRYTPANPNSSVPALSLDETYEASNLDIFSSSYLKLRSLTLTYHLVPSGWMKKAAIANAQLFVSATNVFTLTKYPGSDPETSDDPYSVNGGYIDSGNYPATRTFSLGLKAMF